MTENREVERENGSHAAYWRTLSDVLGSKDPFFEKILFLPGIGFSSNIYIIKGSPLTVVDPGNDYTAYLELFNLGFKPGDIGKIVLTHGHRDHSMGALELLRTYEAGAGNEGPELILHAAGPRQLIDAAKASRCRLTEVRGGERLDLCGLEWEVIHTPGHTVDGICLYHAESKTAITGDVVLPDAMAEPDPAAGGRLDHYPFGIRALLERDIEHVLPGHGTPVLSEGRRVVEETYVGLMMKIIGVEAGARTAWIEGAAALAQKGFLEEAVFCCEKELACRPENTRALQLKACSLNDLGRFQEALGSLDELEELRSQGKDDLYALLGKGYALMGLGRYQESIRFFDSALKVDPGTKDALIYKGMALYLDGNYDAAMEIDHFRTEFVGRFREELTRKKTAASSSEAEE